MTDDGRGLLPNDEKLSVFGFVLDALLAFAASRLLIRGVGALLCAISPAVPSTFCIPNRSRPTRAALWWGAGLGFLFCFAVIAIWSYRDGTFSGNDPNRIYFSRDLPNLIEYAIICPAYVGLAAQLVVLLAFNWARLSNPSQLVVAKSPFLPRAPIGLGVFWILSVSAVGTVNYIREVLNPAMFPKVGWWVERVAVDGSRVLSPLGIYYALLNFTLLSICVLAALAFVSLFLLCVGFGQVVAQQPVSSKISFETLREMLSDFDEAYVVLKILAVALVFNAYAWKHESANGSLNFTALNAALVLFGVFLIPAPRYYIELAWFRFRVRRSQAENAPDNNERDDLRPRYARVIAWIADGTILSGFFYSWLHLPGSF